MEYFFSCSCGFVLLGTWHFFHRRNNDNEIMDVLNMQKHENNYVYPRCQKLIFREVFTDKAKTSIVWP